MALRTETSARAMRVEAHIAPESRAAVKRTAETQGGSQIIQLSLADQDRIAELLATPPTPREALERALRAHNELIRSTR